MNLLPMILGARALGRRRRGFGGLGAFGRRRRGGFGRAAMMGLAFFGLNKLRGRGRRYRR